MSEWISVKDRQNEIIDLIGRAPAVEAVPVVYCKDCKFHHWEQEPCHGKTIHLCSKLKADVSKYFYCAAGKRRD